MSQTNYHPKPDHHNFQGSVVVDPQPKKSFSKRIFTGKIKYLFIFLIILLLVGTILLILRFTIWRPKDQATTPETLDQLYSRVSVEADKIFENSETEDSLTTANQYFEDALKSTTTPEAKFTIERVKIYSLSKHGHNDAAINYATDLEIIYQSDAEKLCGIYSDLLYLFYQSENLDQQQVYIEKMQDTCPMQEGGIG